MTDLTEGPRGVWRWWPLRFLVFFIVMLAVYIGCQIGTQELPKRLPQFPAAALQLALAVVGAFVLVLVYRLLVRWTERRGASELGTAGAIGGFLRGALIGVALFCAVFAILWVCGIATFSGLGSTGDLVAIFTVCLLAGFGEEIAFRGGVFRLLEEGFGTLVALLVSGALFGLMHAPNPGATVVSTVAIALEAGIMLSAAYAMTRSLWLAMGLHFAWNFTEGGIFGAAVSGGKATGLLKTQLSGPPLLTGGEFGPEASVVAVAMCVVLALVMIAITIRRGNWKPMRFRLKT
jgi:membrane protease YdiL (CAAX protease family)